MFVFKTWLYRVRELFVPKEAGAAERTSDEKALFYAFLHGGVTESVEVVVESLQLVHSFNGFKGRSKPMLLYTLDSIWFVAATGLQEVSAVFEPVDVMG